MTANTTRTRADDLRTVPELDALDKLLSGLLEHVSHDGVEDLRRPTEMFSPGTWDWPGFKVSVACGPSQDDLEQQLWDTGTDDFEKDPEYRRTQTLATLLAGRLFCWLASDQAREVCEQVGQELLYLAAAARSREERCEAA